MHLTYKNKEATQNVKTRYYCQWSGGAKEYFNSLEEAMNKAQEMYIRSPKMSEESFKYWLTQSQYIGMETIIETPIKTIFSPNTILT